MTVTTNIPAWPLSDEQKQIVELCRDFATKEIRPRGREVDEADTVTPVDIFAKAAAVGITDFMIPEEYGGGGFTDVFTQCLVQEELCWGTRASETWCAPTGSSPTRSWCWAPRSRRSGG